MKKGMLVLSFLIGILANSICFAHTLEESLDKIQNKISIAYNETLGLRDQQKYGTKCGDFLQDAADNLKVAKISSGNILYNPNSISAWYTARTYANLSNAKLDFYQAMIEVSDCINKENFQNTYDKINDLLHALTNLY